MTHADEMRMMLDASAVKWSLKKREGSIAASKIKGKRITILSIKANAKM